MKTKVVYLRRSLLKQLNDIKLLKDIALAKQGALEMKVKDVWVDCPDAEIAYNKDYDLRIKAGVTVVEAPKCPRCRHIAYKDMTEREKAIHRQWDSYGCREYYSLIDSEWIPTIGDVDGCQLLTYRIVR